MALGIFDRVKETTAVTGTGTATLLGAATGYQSFAAVGNGNTTYYCIAGQGTNEWEVGLGTYTASGTTLSRTTVLASSNAGSLVNFSAGTKDVFVTYPAGKSVYQDASGNVGIGTSIPANKLDLGSGTAGNGITWSQSSTSRYGNIWTQYSSATVYLGDTWTGNTASNTFISTYGSSVARTGIALDGLGGNGIRFFTDPAATIAYGSAYTPTERMRITVNGGISFGSSGTAYGSSGQILQSNGDAAPTWVANTAATADQAYFLSFMMG